MKNWKSLVLGLVLGFLGSAGIWLASSPPRGIPIQLQPAPTAAPLQVHVSGAVNQPGVYTLATRSRVLDAIQAAGGFTQQADDQALNLAAPLEDGQQVWVPSLQTDQASSPETRSPGAPGEPVDSNPSNSPLIDINTATREELETLPGIGPVMADAILAYRASEGPFTRIEEIQKVPGIGPAIFEDIKTLISVGDHP